MLQKRNMAFNLGLHYHKPIQLQDECYLEAGLQLEIN
jgi:hypothetical protein